MHNYDRRSSRYRRVFMAMTLDQAKAVLGLPPVGYPSPPEIQKAYRAKAIQNHPDRGGSHEVMVDINAARDILEGKRREDAHPPVSWAGPGPGADPHVEENRKREQALRVISMETGKATSAAESALHGTDLVSFRVNLSSFLSNEYRVMLDKIHDAIEAAEVKNRDLLKAQALVHTLTGMSHRLSERFLGIIRMTGDGHASLIGLGGTSHLTWQSIAAIYFEIKKFMTAFEEFDKADGTLQSLIVTSELVPNEWVDLTAHERSMVVSYREDFRKFSDHPLKQLGMVMQHAVKEVMEAAGPYGFKHHGDWKAWAIPTDFYDAEKMVTATN